MLFLMSTQARMSLVINQVQIVTYQNYDLIFFVNPGFLNQSNALW